MRVRRFVAIIGMVGLSTALVGVSAAGAGPSGTEATFCKSVLNINLLFNRIDEEPTPKQEKKIDTLFGRIEKNAPAELTESVDAVLTAFGEDPELLFEDPEVMAAIQAIDLWIVDNCEYEVIDVTGTEYEFGDIPDTIDAGVVLFRFTNEGAEVHEIGVARLKGDITLEEALEDEGDENIEFVGGTFALQGESSVAYLNLKKPGRYGAACFVPVGSLDPDTEVDGPPHAVEGMATEFTVEK